MRVGVCVTVETVAEEVFLHLAQACYCYGDVWREEEGGILQSRPWQTGKETSKQLSNSVESTAVDMMMWRIKSKKKQINTNVHAKSQEKRAEEAEVADEPAVTFIHCPTTSSHNHHLQQDVFGG